ncbi:MAG: hypothetical protein DRJ42_26620 [Deltaproteobacteria bacterium]|nr:MAG: hypothetical protein DRJ42_26620 [Deltaproteobacteria bacterium]
MSRSELTRSVATAFALLVFGVAVVGSGVGLARADDFHIDSDTAFQAYEVRSPGTAVFMARRRLLQTLALTWSRPVAEPAVGDEPTPRVAASLRLRLDQDFGQTCLIDRDYCARATESGARGSYQPLASDTDVDAPEAWVELRGLPAAGRLRLGRHLSFGPAGMLRLDGASGHVAPSAWLSFQAFGGAVVRQTSLAGGVGTFEPQGIVRRDLDDGVSPERVPWIDEPTTTWAAGGTVSLGHARYLQARVGYRHILEDAGNVAATGALTLTSNPVPAFSVTARGVWDFIGAGVQDAQAEVTVAPHETLSFRARAEHHVPRFDYGSIWMYFDLVPITEGLLSATFHPTRRFEVGVGARARYASLGAQGEEQDVGFEGHGLFRALGFDVALSGSTWGGDLGPVASVLVDIQRPIVWWARLDARASVWHFDDPLREGLYGTSVAEALGVIFTLSEPTTLRLDFEHSYNRVAGNRFRFIAHLSVDVWR